MNRVTVAVLLIGALAGVALAQSAQLVKAVVVSAAPTYTAGNISNLTQTTGGALRVSCD